MKGIYVCERSQPSSHPDGVAHSVIEPARRRPPSGRVTRVTPWIVRFEQAGAPDDHRPRVAVKDAIDLAGVPTTAGCVAVRDRATPAPADAACLAGFRAAGVTIVGKTTLTELCLSPTGVNEAFGMPVNPLAPDLIPGGSSSGSAVVVASGEADLALGTDTGGSVRIPAACCGLVGLKTTLGPDPAARGVAARTHPGHGRPDRPGRGRCGRRAPPARPVLARAGPARRHGRPAAHRGHRPGGGGRHRRGPGGGRVHRPQCQRFEGGRPRSTRSPRSSWASCGGAITTWSTPPVSSRWANKALHRGRAVSDGQVAEALAARADWQAELAEALRGHPRPGAAHAARAAAAPATRRAGSRSPR